MPSTQNRKNRWKVEYFDQSGTKPQYFPDFEKARARAKKASGVVFEFADERKWRANNREHHRQYMKNWRTERRARMLAVAEEDEDGNDSETSVDLISTSLPSGGS